MKADLALYDKGGLILDLYLLSHPRKKSIFHSEIFCLFFLLNCSIGRDPEHFVSKTIDVTYMKAILAVFVKGSLFLDRYLLSHPRKKSIFQSEIFCFFWTFQITKLLYRTRLDHFMSNMIDVSYVKALVSLLDEGSPFSD